MTVSEVLAANTLQATQKGGEQPEYHTAYGNFIFEQLSQLMTTPPSQRVYDAAAAIYRDVMWDVAANFAPATGTMTGPSGRNYDLFLGSQNGWEAYTFPLYLQPFFHPYCDALATCTPSTLDVQTPPVSAPPATRVFDTFFGMWQLGGFGVFPYRDDQALFQTGYRTNVQRAGFTAGKDRQHFVSPYYSMGNAGDGAYLAVDNYTLTARLGGRPNPKYTWTIEAKIAGHALRVRRQDVYQAWNNSPAYKQFDGSFPYYPVFERTWDGKPTMPDDWSDTSTFVQQNKAVKISEANLTIPHSAAEFFQPHLAQP